MIVDSFGRYSVETAHDHETSLREGRCGKTGAGGYNTVIPVTYNVSQNGSSGHGAPVANASRNLTAVADDTMKSPVKVS